MAELGDALSKLALNQPASLAPDAPEATETGMTTCGTDISGPAPATITDFERILGQVSELLRTSSGPSPEMRILKQLYFPSMYHREDYMQSPEEGTFEWLLVAEGTAPNSSAVENEDGQDGLNNRMYRFEDQERDVSRSKLLGWLRNDHGIFHIVGKAGAGKSTLMKLLVRHERVREELRHWAGTSTLLFGHFFFWRAGGDKQNSLEGLFRSMLFETLSKNPEMLQHVFPEAYRKISRSMQNDCIEELYFRQDELKNAFSRLVKLSVPDDSKLCLFIDGLDEYGDDKNDKQHHEDLAHHLLQWGASENVKLLVSSRPEREFTKAFSDPHHVITLHHHTKRDIRQYARQSLKRHQDYTRISTHAQRLTEEVVTRAEGVFVWARFAISTICQATRDGFYELEELLDELKQLPDEMDDIYMTILRRHKSKTQQKRAMILLQAVSMSSKVAWRLHPLTVLHIDRWHEPDFPFRCDREEWTAETFSQKLNQAKSRIHSLSGGLIEIVQPYGERRTLSAYLQIFHRTLHDFLHQSPDVKFITTESDDTYTSDFYLRVSLSNFWFNNVDNIWEVCHPLALGIRHNEDLSLEILDTAFKNEWASRLMPHHFPDFIEYGLCSDANGCMWSFPHWVMAERSEIPYDLVEAWANSEICGQYQDSLSLIVSAAANPYAPLDELRTLLPNLDRLLSLGHSGNCHEERGRDNPQVPLWLGALLSFSESLHKFDGNLPTSDHLYSGSEKILATIWAGFQTETKCDYFIIFSPERARKGELLAASIPQFLLGFINIDGRYHSAQGSEMESESYGDSDSERSSFTEEESEWREKWRGKITEQLETTNLTNTDGLWANHNIIPVRKSQMCQGWWQNLAPVFVDGIARAAHDPGCSSVALDITWTSCYSVRRF